MIFVQNCCTLDKLVESLQEICAYVRSRGTMEVALETFDFDMDKRCLLGRLGAFEHYWIKRRLNHLENCCLRRLYAESG
jgi:hypothetical protein